METMFKFGFLNFLKEAAPTFLQGLKKNLATTTRAAVSKTQTAGDALKRRLAKSTPSIRPPVPKSGPVSRRLSAQKLKPLEAY